jgi:hypothetical protein
VEPADLVLPGQAKRLAELREASGSEVGELASILGISYEAYHDLEWFDEEIADALSFDQLVTLANAIQFDLRRFFDAHDIGHVTFAELAVRLEPFARSEAALAALENQVGWELRRHLDDPSTFAELPAVALADIGEPVGVDWRSLLPRSSFPLGDPPSNNP